MRDGQMDGLSEVGPPSSAGSPYVATPSKSHFADTTLPGARGTSIRAVKVTASPAATLGALAAVGLEMDHGAGQSQFWVACEREWLLGTGPRAEGT